MRKHLVHFYYPALTMKDIPEHSDALRDEILRAQLFNRAAAPWEGGFVSLQYVMTHVCQHWLMHFHGVPSMEPTKCLFISEEEIQNGTSEYDQEQEKVGELKWGMLLGCLAGFLIMNSLKSPESSRKRSRQNSLGNLILKGKELLSESISPSKIMTKMYESGPTVHWI